MRGLVAIKVLPTARAVDPTALERFYLEARGVAALDHPNVVSAHDVDRDEQLYFLVMEHIDGSNLQEIVRISGPMDPVRASHYIRQAAFGLQHAHEAAGLIHRDIKPGNILVDRNGVVKVLDMGLAPFSTRQKTISSHAARTASWVQPTTWHRSRPSTVATSISVRTSTVWERRSTSF